MLCCEFYRRRNVGPPKAYDSDVGPPKAYDSDVRPPKAYNGLTEGPTFDLQKETAEGRVKTMPSNTKREIERTYSTIKAEDEQLTKIVRKNRYISWYMQAFIFLPLMYWLQYQQPYTSIFR